MRFEEARYLLQKEGQEHLLRFWDDSSASQRDALLCDIDRLNFAQIARMRELLRDKGAAPSGSRNIEPASVLIPTDEERREAAVRGVRELGEGRVGVILVAGGQGTRLGYDGPKGSFPIAPLSNASLFEIHARKVLALERAYATQIPFYIMTSAANDAATREFLAGNDYFGLSADRVHCFQQGMWPALSEDGRIILETPQKIFRSPDGHGGLLDALQNNGMLRDMAGRGIETLFYFQVDNPLVEICDPVFIGMHCSRDIDISCKVCEKRDPEEGLGVVVVRDGRNALCEYTELTRDQKYATREDGSLVFRYGSVAIHVFSRSFLQRMADADLPLHVAHKKVPHCDDSGATIEPNAPNAYKFEKFIFDVIPEAERTLNLVFDRRDEFSPVKNAEGNDSPGTARRDMIRKFARWLEACGVDVPRTENGEVQVKIEIDPCYALGPEALREKLPKGFELDGDMLLSTTPAGSSGG